MHNTVKVIHKPMKRQYNENFLSYLPCLCSDNNTTSPMGSIVLAVTVVAQWVTVVAQRVTVVAQWVTVAAQRVMGVAQGDGRSSG
jgi:hypothetical protein